MEAISITKFMQDQGFTSLIPKIRHNVNEYPYVTFIKTEGDKNISENIYLSKNSAELLEEKELDTVNKEFIDTFKVSLVEYEDSRESRFKIVSGKSQWLSLDDLLAM